MVCVGDTVVLPLTGTVPTPLMDTVLAPVVVQLRVDEPPGAMLSGLVSKRMICGLPAGAAPTVTVAEAVTLPVGPVAVRVYVVVDVGVTVVVPVAATLPMLLLMLMAVAPCTTQFNVELWPALIWFGVASKRTMSADCGVLVLTCVNAEELRPATLVTVNLKV